MTTKNLEKLAEIGEKKLLGDLINNLMEIKQSSMNIQQDGNSNGFQTNALDRKMKSYRHLITTCKNCGLDVNEQEKIYAQIISNAEEYLKEKETQLLSELSIKTQYGSEIEIE